MIYFCLSPGGGKYFGRDVLGNVPIMLGIQDNADFGGYVFNVRQAIAAAYLDYEPDTFPALVTKGLAKTRAKSAAKQLTDHAATMRASCRKIRAELPSTSIGVYGLPPIAHNAYYGESQAPYVGDNAKISASGLYLDADWMANNAYLGVSLAPVSAEAARNFTLAKIDAGEIYGIRQIVFLMPVYEGSGQELPDDVLFAQIDAAIARGKDVCLWCGECDLALAQRWVAKVQSRIGAAAAAGVAK